MCLKRTTQTIVHEVIADVDEVTHENCTKTMWGYIFIISFSKYIARVFIDYKEIQKQFFFKFGLSQREFQIHEIR